MYLHNKFERNQLKRTQLNYYVLITIAVVVTHIRTIPTGSDIADSNINMPTYVCTNNLYSL